MHLLKTIAFVCKSLGDGLTRAEVYDYVSNNIDEYDLQFVTFCTNFCLENKWLAKMEEGDRYSVTALGREFISSQFG
jgi:hypothetical protein